MLAGMTQQRKRGIGSFEGREDTSCRYPGCDCPGATPGESPNLKCAKVSGLGNCNYSCKRWETPLPALAIHTPCLSVSGFQFSPVFPTWLAGEDLWEWIRMSLLVRDREAAAPWATQQGQETAGVRHITGLFLQTAFAHI